jgi:hypothetical protein
MRSCFLTRHRHPEASSCTATPRTSHSPLDREPAKGRRDRIRPAAPPTGQCPVSDTPGTRPPGCQTVGCSQSPPSPGPSVGADGRQGVNVVRRSRVGPLRVKVRTATGLPPP